MMLTWYILSYFIGSIDFAYIISRIHGIKLENFGDGNLGATNLMYALIKKKRYSKLRALFYFLVVGALDAFKAFLPVIIFDVYAGVAAILGHCFSLLSIIKTKKIPSGVGLASSIGWVLAVDYRIIIVVGIVVLPFVFYFRKHFEKERGHIYSVFAYPFASLLYIILFAPPSDVVNSLVLINTIVASARMMKIKGFLETCLK